MKQSGATEQLEPWLSEGSDASPELRDFLRIASAAPEDGARVERLRQRLGPWLAVVPASLSAPAHPPAAPAASSGAGVAVSSAPAGLAALGKAGLLAAALGVVAAAALGLRAEPPRRAPAVPTPTPSVAASAPSTARAKATLHAPVAPPPQTSSATAARGPSRPSAPQSVSFSGARRESLAEEATELGAARRALASSPAIALALLKEHAAEHPRSALAEERRLFTIEALVRLGRTQDAQQELSALRQSSPQSPHLARAERLLGVEMSQPR